MAFAIIAFLVAFLLIGSGGLLIFYRDRIQERISSALYPRANKKTMSTTIEETRHVIGGVVEQFEKILPRSQAEISAVQQRLVRAGMRSDTAVKSFYGAKVMTPVFLMLLSWVTGLIHFSPFFILILCSRSRIPGSRFLAGKKDLKPAEGNKKRIA